MRTNEAAEAAAAREPSAAPEPLPPPPPTPRRRALLSNRAVELRAKINEAETEAAVARWLLRRLAVAAWPESALTAEARLAGISSAALYAAASRLRIAIVDGRCQSVRLIAAADALGVRAQRGPAVAAMRVRHGAQGAS